MEFCITSQPINITELQNNNLRFCMVLKWKRRHIHVCPTLGHMKLYFFSAVATFQACTVCSTDPQPQFCGVQHRP